MFVIAVVVALIGAVSGIAGTVISVRSQRRVTYLSSSLEEQRAESDARRAYEYEARKRLYEVYEPLRLRLLECTDNAVAEMDRLVGQAGPGRPGFSSAEYQVTAAVYFLLAPLAVSRMIERRLTLVDLSLDKRIYTEFVLAQRICRSVSDEFAAANLHPPLPYTPYVKDWQDKRQQSPQQYRRQGLPLGRLNTALDALHITRPSDVDTLITFGEFEPGFRQLDTANVRSGPGAARDLFAEFDPVTRPVLWRVLIIQAMLYWCYQTVVFGEEMPDLDNLEQAFTASDIHATLKAAFFSRSDHPQAEDLKITTSAAAAYVAERLAPALRRVRLLAAPTTPTGT
jgi:hypothetical protein